MAWNNRKSVAGQAIRKGEAPRELATTRIRSITLILTVYRTLPDMTMPEMIRRQKRSYVRDVFLSAPNPEKSRRNRGCPPPSAARPFQKPHLIVLQGIADFHEAAPGSPIG